MGVHAKRPSLQQGDPTFGAEPIRDEQKMDDAAEERHDRDQLQAARE